MNTQIPRALRLRIERAARYRCGYCHTQSAAIGMPLEIDHLIPLSLGGTSEEENLWLACPQCNRYKAAQVEAVDPEIGQMVALFNPRAQRWQEHFAWQQSGLYVIGISPTGRASVYALQMNNAWIVRARQVWIVAGIPPPRD